jgi:hypothetical protein
MKFKLYTLIDITETGSRKGDDPRKIQQQQNFLTILQTIGLRVNPAYDQAPVVLYGTADEFNLGTSFKNRQSIWVFDFDIEHEDAMSINTLVNDFNLVPIIDHLDETAEFENAHFVTGDTRFCNIVFELVEYK